jgi:hypothetical protein
MNKGKSRTEILEGEGWTKQFAASEPRLSEAVDVYRGLGFEVHLESILREDLEDSECVNCPSKDDEDDCPSCLEDFKKIHKVIFTRPKKTEW